VPGPLSFDARTTRRSIHTPLPPVSPARGPPTEWAELVQAHDERDAIQSTDRRCAGDRHPQPLSGAGRDPRMSGNCELGRGLRRREKNANKAGAGRFEKPSPYAWAAPPEAQQSFISRKTVVVVPLTGLSFISHQSTESQRPDEHRLGPLRPAIHIL
jgi:hypothetical protein